MKNRWGVKQWKWMVYLTMALPYVIVYFHRVALSVVASNLTAEFQLSGVMIGLLASVYFYVYTCMQIPSGIMADYWGPRKTVTFGMMLAFVGSLLFALSPTPALLFISRFLISIGVSVIFIAILKIQTAWFMQSEFARVTGITVLIGNGGAVLAATPLALLVSLTNWRFAFVVMSLISLLAAGLSWFLTKNSPKEVGLEPPPGTMQEVPHQKTGRKEIGAALYQVVTNRWTLLLCLAFFSVFGSFLTFQGMWGVPYFMHVFHMPKEAAANLLLIASIGHMIGALSVGTISDKLGKRKPVYLGYLTLYTFSWALLTFYPLLGLSTALLYPLSFMIGFFASCFILTFAWAKEINDPTIPGIAMGATNMFGFLGAAIMQPLYGFILDQGWDGQMANGAPVYLAESYRLAFLISLGTLLVAIVAVYLMRETNNRNVFAEIRSNASTWITSPAKKWADSATRKL